MWLVFPLFLCFWGTSGPLISLDPGSKAGFHKGQCVPEPRFISILWAPPPWKQEPIFLAGKPQYTP